MAATVVFAGKQSLPKSVQEMAINGDEPPQEFIVKESKFGPKETSAISIPIPIIDVRLLSSEDELEKLRSALSSGGCFQAVGHGISSAFLDRVREVGKRFFTLSMEEKEKYARAPAVTDSEGYGNDVIVSEKQVRDWNYRLALDVYPQHRRKPALWPQNPSDFSEMLDEYSTKIKLLMDVLLKAMAKSLNLEEGCFLKQFADREMMHSRFNYYPRCSKPDLVLGVKPHTDSGTVTILLQDREVEGLQILIDDKWVNVPTIPDAFVVNLGDQMQIMSNGIFKSPLHRVVTNTEKLRMSVAMFNLPDPEIEIGPVDNLIDEKRPRLYQNVKDYNVIHYKCYQEGIVPLEAIKFVQHSDQN
ncbi:2-oxoglutarate (2OG) and Fe(II)-dependent oxygenase superfamily protein [Quillaja saponaria]|uniref:2-oxoglutarate (2OG) and Fe(II)-dependent oxygenase superfamily protein n=1 Tax=Quillaja saponaria TaxID=32244 RepID=A0AAD7QCK3_QUISA|nr:2-oxoglutarate (2OG) and Fe(II)-dependent oxygenase superfamily protein [Quillaja saponaria]